MYSVQIIYGREHRYLMLLNAGRMAASPSAETQRIRIATETRSLPWNGLGAALGIVLQARCGCRVALGEA